MKEHAERSNGEQRMTPRMRVGLGGDSKNSALCPAPFHFSEGSQLSHTFDS
jgi:hypothetical protein